MTNNKKDVHRTGALASILSQTDIKPVDIIASKKSIEVKDRPFSSDILNPPLKEKENSEILIEIPPSSCSPWGFSDRLEPEMGNIEELAASIHQAGQQEPILVRPVKSNDSLSTKRYEIIFGNRRWRACSLLNKNVLAIVRNLSDQEAALAQKEENENRRDISDYSKAVHYKKLINSKIFENENQLSMKLNIPRNRLNDLMSYNRIPEEIIESISNIHNMSQRTAIKIASLSREKENIQYLLKLTPKISENKITSTNIEKELKNLKDGKESKEIKKSYPVIGKGGAELFTIREDSNGAPCIVLHKVSRQAVDLEDLKNFIKAYIDKQIEENFNQSEVQMSGV